MEYKRDPLGGINEIYVYFNELCNLSKGFTEWIQFFDVRFAAQVKIFNVIATTTEMQAYISTALLFSNYYADDSQIA